jgi:hypothetical protein
MVTSGLLGFAWSKLRIARVRNTRKSYTLFNKASVGKIAEAFFYWMMTLKKPIAEKVVVPVERGREPMHRYRSSSRG